MSRNASRQLLFVSWPLAVAGCLVIAVSHEANAGATHQASQNTAFTGGLVGLWSFNGPDLNGTTAYDRSGNGNNGTLTNGPVPATGRIGQGVQFDGMNDVVRITDPGASSVFDFANGDSITLAAWIYPTAFADFTQVLEKGNLGCGVLARPWGFGTGAGSGFQQRLRFSYNSAAVCHEYRTNNNVFTANQWYHIAVTYTFGTAASMAMYVDGVAQAGSWYSGTGTVAPISNNDQLGIGARDTTPTKLFTGLIDDVRVYNRALSAQEVADLYNLGR